MAARPWRSIVWSLEMLARLRESTHCQQAARRLRRRDFVMLEDPGVAVGNKDCVEASRECWINIRPGAVSNHPRSVVREPVLANHRAVNSHILLGHDLYCCKIFLQAGALDLSRLLRDRS